MDEQELTARLSQVKQAIRESAERSGRRPEDITLVAVSKLHPAEKIIALAKTGHLAYGENYVQEALAKQEAIDMDLRWHFIGHLQRNKVKYVIGNFTLIHTVDSDRLARALHNRSDQQKSTQNVLIQVNIGREPQKFGIEEENVSALVESVLSMSGLKLKGFMTMPPFGLEEEVVRPYFRRLREIRDTMEDTFATRLPHLSMGMSHDFIPAIEEGATILRVGTQIFGPRPPK